MNNITHCKSSCWNGCPDPICKSTEGRARAARTVGSQGSSPHRAQMVLQLTWLCIQPFVNNDLLLMWYVGRQWGQDCLLPAQGTFMCTRFPRQRGPILRTAFASRVASNALSYSRYFTITDAAMSTCPCLAFAGESISWQPPHWHQAVLHTDRPSGLAQKGKLGQTCPGSEHCYPLSPTHLQSRCS